MQRIPKVHLHNVVLAYETDGNFLSWWYQNAIGAHQASVTKAIKIVDAFIEKVYNQSEESVQKGDNL